MKIFYVIVLHDLYNDREHFLCDELCLKIDYDHGAQFIT